MEDMLSSLRWWRLLQCGLRQQKVILHCSLGDSMVVVLPIELLVTLFPKDWPKWSEFVNGGQATSSGQRTFLPFPNTPIFSCVPNLLALSWSMWGPWSRKHLLWLCGELSTEELPASIYLCCSPARWRSPKSLRICPAITAGRGYICQRENLPSLAQKGVMWKWKRLWLVVLL